MESPGSSNTARAASLKLSKLSHLLWDNGSPGLARDAISDLVFSIFLAAFCEQLRAVPFPMLQTSEAHQFMPQLIAHLKRLGLALRCNLFLTEIPEQLRLKPELLSSLFDDCRKSASGMSLEDLICVFEAYFAPQSRNKDGTFYTPPTIAKRIARDSIDLFLAANKSRRIHELKVLDPACGGGIFLLEAYRCLSARLPECFPGRAALLVRCIFGVDKDPRAAELTRLVLTLALLQEEQLELFYDRSLPDLSRNIICANSLLDRADFDPDDRGEQQLLRSLNAISWHSAFPDVFARKGFDCVIGNPPYGLSRDEQIGPEENVKLKQVYAQFRHGKINKYLAFMAKGFEILNPDGVLSFIVPNAWLGIDGGQAVRSMLLESGALRRIVSFDCAVFGAPSVEAVIFEATPGSKNDTISVFRTATVDFVPAQPSFEIPVQKCLERPGRTIPLIWSPAAEIAMKKIRDSSVRLGSPDSGFVSLIALQAYAQGKGNPPQKAQAAQDRIFHTRTKDGQDAYPYLEGVDIERYCSGWSGEYLRYGPWLAEYQPLERFSGPRILIREIIKPPPYVLSACLLSDTCLYNRSILHIRPKTEMPEINMWALLAIMNSKLASFVIRFTGRKSQRRIFPKIVNADLRDFPVLRELPAHAARLGRLAQSAAALKLQLKAAEAAMSQQALFALPLQLSEAVPPQLTELQNEIDQAVCAAYGLDPEHVAALEEVLTA